MHDERLGKKMRDTVTGFEGIATSKVYFLTGCTQFGLTPRITGENKRPETEYFDEQRLEVVDDARAPVRTSPTGGDMGRETPRY